MFLQINVKVDETLAQFDELRFLRLFICDVVLVNMFRKCANSS